MNIDMMNSPIPFGPLTQVLLGFNRAEDFFQSVITSDESHDSPVCLAKEIMLVVRSMPEWKPDFESMRVERYAKGEWSVDVGLIGEINKQLESQQ